MKIKRYNQFVMESKMESKIEPEVLLDFSELRQTWNFDCGASALQQVLVYYGVEEREDNLIKQLETTPTDIQEHGTKLSKMKEVAEYYGLTAEVRGKMSVEEIVQLIDEGTPVILLIQAWRDFSKNTDWKSDYDDGHYCTAIGYNSDCLFFEDPSSFTRTYLTKEELNDRWHDLGDDNKTKVEHVAVVIKGEKKFNSKEIVHMD